MHVSISSKIDKSVDKNNFNNSKTEKRGKVGNLEWMKEMVNHENAYIMSEMIQI